MKVLTFLFLGFLFVFPVTAGAEGRPSPKLSDNSVSPSCISVEPSDIYVADLYNRRSNANYQPGVKIINNCSQNATINGILTSPSLENQKVPTPLVDAVATSVNEEDGRKSIGFLLSSNDGLNCNFLVLSQNKSKIESICKDFSFPKNDEMVIHVLNGMYYTISGHTGTFSGSLPNNSSIKIEGRMFQPGIPVPQSKPVTPNPPSCKSPDDCKDFCKGGGKGKECKPDGIPSCSDGVCNCALTCL